MNQSNYRLMYSLWEEEIHQFLVVVNIYGLEYLNKNDFGVDNEQKIDIWNKKSNFDFLRSVLGN